MKVIHFDNGKIESLLKDVHRKIEETKHNLVKKSTEDLNLIRE